MITNKMLKSCPFSSMCSKNDQTGVSWGEWCLHWFLWGQWQMTWVTSWYCDKWQSVTTLLIIYVNTVPEFAKLKKNLITTCDDHFLFRYPYLMTMFCSGTDIWEPFFVPVPIFESHFLFRYPVSRAIFCSGTQFSEGGWPQKKSEKVKFCQS